MDFPDIEMNWNTKKKKDSNLAGVENCRTPHKRQSPRVPPYVQFVQNCFVSD